MRTQSSWKLSGKGHKEDEDVDGKDKNFTMFAANFIELCQGDMAL